MRPCTWLAIGLSIPEGIVRDDYLVDVGRALQDLVWNINLSDILLNFNKLYQLFNLEHAVIVGPVRYLFPSNTSP